MAGEQNAGVVRRVIDEIWNGADLALADVLFAPGYVNHEGVIPDAVRGPEAIKISVALYRTAFPQLHVTVEDLVANGETVALRWTARGAPPTGRTREAAGDRGGALTGVTLSHLCGGQIVESWTSWDVLDALRRLGVFRRAEPHRTAR